MLHAGIDIGSKTIKLVIMDEEGNLLHDSYSRHLSNVKDTLSYTLQNAALLFPDEQMTLGVTGSAGMQIAEDFGFPFVQEVVAAHEALKRFIPDADVCIDIGGEDSKILFLTGSEEMRMNSTCAGGTGGFIDTIAGMLDINAEKLNTLAYGCTNVYPIASRCAVFAQSDVRPLINEGVSKEDIAGSVFDAVVTQCITGLACGRRIGGNLAMLGGPLHFLSNLRERFRVRLGLSEESLRVPPDGHLFVAMGAALAVSFDNEAHIVSLPNLLQKLNDCTWDGGLLLQRMDPLFESKADYTEFRLRHAEVDAPRFPVQSYEGPMYLGVDSGSEAIKFVLIGEQGQVLRTYYQRSAGNIIDAAQEMFESLWKRMPLDFDGSYVAHIARAGVTGYGEAFLKAAYAFDFSEVETVAHVRAAQELVPDVDFLLDIGGQDMKCVFLRDGEVDNVVLNEACSSGCGALISGMAWSMNVKLDSFINQALYAGAPVDLGTRCTVFMTSRVRHAQKEGACIGDLAAGLAYSVVRNALYKVIRARDLSELGQTIVVEGGTFMNDAVLRAFEKLLGREVVRPEMAPYMGAYGMALLARDQAKKDDHSSIIPIERVRSLHVEQRNETCKKCTNACLLVKTFFKDNGVTRSITVGNRCERGLDLPQKNTHVQNLFDKRNLRMFGYSPQKAENAPRGSLGLVRALDMYDLYPFWFTVFDELGFRVRLSNIAAGALKDEALETIPAESLCYPAKIVHGGVIDLLQRNVEVLFTPYIQSVRGKGLACPVVAGYPLVIDSNIDLIHEKDVRIVAPSFSQIIEDGKPFAGVGAVLRDAFAEIGINISEDEVDCAVDAGVAEQLRFEAYMQNQGESLIESLSDTGKRGIVCAGRPYHTDPLIHHLVPELLNSYGYSVLTVDSVAHLARNTVAESSWEYPEKILDAARVVARHDSLEMVQLYSFGCGLDAVTVDCARDILKESGKTLTALKMDEMVDLAAAKIRIRSMIAAQEGRIGRSSTCRHTEQMQSVRTKLVLYDNSNDYKRGKLSNWRKTHGKF